MPSPKCCTSTVNGHHRGATEMEPIRPVASPRGCLPARRENA
ncbi:MAG TPA: hypothetical protein V6D02_12645 [Candidatus Obscuribacterales bacterium]